MIRFTGHYKLDVSVSEEDILERLINYCETKDLIIFKTRGRRGVLRRESKITKLWEPISGDTIRIDAGLIDYLAAWIRTVKDRKIVLDVDVPRVQSVELNTHWSSILRDDQKEDVLMLTKSYGGLAAQHTGFGKTLCLLSIVDCLPERSLILVPSSGILSEVQQRGSEFGIYIPHYEWENKIEIVNPIGFLRSKEVKKPHVQAWLKEVINVFTDEAHHLQATSWNELFRYLPNIIRSYGFSASPDSKDGKHLTPAEIEIRNLGYKSAKIIGLSGSTRVRRRSKTKVTLVDVYTEITPSYSPTVENWQESLDVMLKRPECARIIAEVMRKFPNIKFYIPIHKIDSGRSLFKNILKCGVRGIFWQAGVVYNGGSEVKTTGNDELSYVKTIVKRRSCRFLMTTSVAYEGIDIPNLSGIIPLTGKSYRMVMQPAGRSARGKELTYVLIHDNNNKTMKSQTRERRVKITREYDVVRTVKLSF
jgi:hypothetical protein